MLDDTNLIVAVETLSDRVETLTHALWFIEAAILILLGALVAATLWRRR